MTVLSLIKNHEMFQCIFVIVLKYSNLYLFQVYLYVQLISIVLLIGVSSHIFFPSMISQYHFLLVLQDVAYEQPALETEYDT